MVNSRSDGWHDVVVLMPEQFNDALEAVLAVREQRTVVLNLSRLTPELAQRATDLVSGGVHALDGQQQRISEMVLLLAPAGVAINRIAAAEPGQPRRAPPQLDPAPAVQPKQCCADRIRSLSIGIEASRRSLRWRTCPWVDRPSC